MSPPTTQSALVGYLDSILSTPSIAIVSDSSTPIELRTTALLLHSARTATVPQLVQLILHILLNQPPFTHDNPADLRLHQERFLTLWTNDTSLISNTGLGILSALRADFQQLGDSGFRFVCELLLPCIRQLSPEGQNIRGWVDAHAVAVKVLGQLLHSIPAADWLRLDEQAMCALPVWRCLQLLTSGAAWWGGESTVYRDNLLRLAKCVFSLPCSASLLRVVLRVDMKPQDVHSVVATLLLPLERRLGLSTAEKLNAFTPSPYKFPTIPTLDRHDFSREYEFANLRVMFVSWINGDDVHRHLSAFRAPWDMQAALQHTEAFRKLKTHPESAVRVALVYIFNEVQTGCEGFKASTDLRAVELLKIYIGYAHAKKDAGTSSPLSSRTSLKDEIQIRPESCVTANADWVIPWLWKRRATDSMFAMVMTSAWLASACTVPLSQAHPVLQVIMKHAKNAFEVFHDLFRNVFSHEFVANSADPVAALHQIRKLVRVVLDATVLVGKERPALVSQQLCMLIIRCYVESLDQEWITVEGWKRACEVLASVPKVTLSDATKLAQVLEGIELFIPIFLREMEAITATCDTNKAAASLPVDTLKKQLENLTAMVQFSTLLAKSHDAICSAFAKRSHLISALIRYVSTSHRTLLLSSPVPELHWFHSASVGSLLQLLVVTGFGVNRTPSLSVASISSASRESEIGSIVMVVMERSFEMSYVIAGLCSLLPLVREEWWIENPFIYLETWSCIRSVLLQQDAREWSPLLPSFTVALTTLLKVVAPIRQILLSSRWNLTLCAKLLKLLLSPTSPPQPQGTANIVCLLLSSHPPWRDDLKKEAALGAKTSFVAFEEVEEKVKALGVGEQAEALVRVLESWGWGRARGLRRWVKAERKMGEEGWYKMFLPVEGGAGVLVFT